MATGNRLTEILGIERIQRSALAKASGVSERIIKRIEEIDGAPNLELKARLVSGLNKIVGQKRYETGEIFTGWQAHRRDAKR